MTEEQAYKTIADRAEVLAKDEKIKSLVRQKFGKNYAAAKRYIYKLAISTLYGIEEGK
jgi:predicted nucleic-acid-binding protein